MKKVLSLILSILLIASVVPLELFSITASAQEYTSGYYKYTVSNGEATITGGLYATSHIVIPEYIDGYTVTGIGSRAFYECTNLISVTIGDSVTIIGYWAFGDCANLTSVEFGDSVTRIGEGAFRGCTSLTSVEFGDSVTSIGVSAFLGCASLTSVEFGDSVTSIDENAFLGCTSLTSVVVPNSVTSIGAFAFEDCTSLTSVEFGDSVKIIGDDAFRGCTSLTSVVVPNSVTKIGTRAFYNCTSLTSVKFGRVVSGIDIGASIGDWAFRGCTSLTSVEFGDRVTSIGDYAFYNCTSLTSVEFGSRVTSIGESAFYNCTSLTSVEFDNRVTSIGESAFEDCTSLTSVELGDSVKSIGDWAFHDCTSLTSVEFGDSVKSIGDYAFYNCLSLEVLDLPQNLEFIGSYAFFCCEKIKAVEIPNKITTIYGGTFWGCQSLQRVFIPVSVTKIEDDAFSFGFFSTGTLPFVWYSGTSSQKAQISIDDSNDLPYDWYYEACKTEHTYSATCDISCDKCGWIRENVVHTDDNACDSICNVCGYTRSAPHYFKWVIDKQETCGESGRKHEECTVCRTKRNENTVIAATGNHIYTFVWSNDSDSHYYECSVCAAKKDIENHNYDNACDSICNVCGYTRSAPHNFKWVIDKQETCGESGQKHEECTVCHTKRNENTVIEATGNHIYTFVWSNDSDSHYYECSVCAAKKDIENHNYDDACDSICNVCGYTRSAPHTFKWVIDKQETCGESGQKHEECTVCHAKRNENTVISATDVHTYDNDKDNLCNVCGCKRLYLCSSCNGSGTVPTEGDCKNCKGAGKVESYNLSFNANGGSGAPNDQTILGYANKLVNGIPTKTGYVFKGWKLLYEDTVYQPGDVYNAGENTLYAIWYIQCENCNGSGSVASTWNCSTCNGEGRRRYCTKCGSDYITKYVTGNYGTFYSCASCGSRSTSTRSCSSCGGGGVSTGTVSCSHCSGVGGLKEDNPATNLPVVESNDKSSITLAFVEGHEYSLDGINWQSDTTFNGLESGVEYTFYQRVRVTNNAVCGVASEGRKVIILSAGDLDEDDDISDWDGVLLARHLAGWNVGVSDSVLDIDGDGEVTDWDGVMFDRYLAGWSVDVFIGTGKAVSVCSIKYTDDKNAENANPTTYKTGQKLKLLPLEKEHYKFDGWYYMGETITELSGNENGDIILIAQWTPVKYNVTYLDTRNNTNSLNPKYITADDGTLNLFDLPATNGYAFDGWVDSSGRKVTSIVATGQDITLTATWVFDSVAIIETKHNYNTKKYEVSYTYTSEMNATGNFTVTYQVSIKNVWDMQIAAGSVWFQLVDKNGNYAGSSFSAGVAFLPVGETYVWEHKMNAVPKGEHTLIISD